MPDFLLEFTGASKGISKEHYYKTITIIRTMAEIPQGKRIQIFSPPTGQAAGACSYINLGGKTVTVR